MLYSVELPYLKKVYYGESKTKMDINDFVEMVRAGKIFINDENKHIFECQTPSVVLREITFPSGVEADDFALNELIVGRKEDPNSVHRYLIVTLW